jgi:hypothetical protein
MDKTTPAPSTNSSSLEESNPVALLVTKLGHNQPKVKRSDALTWGMAMIREIMSESEAKWEGNLKAVIPLTEQVEGFLYKMIFHDVPEELLRSVVIPGMQLMGCNARFEPRAVTAMHRRNMETTIYTVKDRVRDIGNVGPMQTTLTKIMDMRGEGGPEAKRRKCGNEAMSILHTSVKIGAHKLEENKEEDA